jgi:hypothetical protein
MELEVVFGKKLKGVSLLFFGERFKMRLKGPPAVTLLKD